jgi:hypothetical protein
MKKILHKLFFLGLLFTVSCKKNITDLNVNPNRPTTVASETLFANAAVNLSDLMAHTNVNYNNFRLFVQYWTETIYRDETRYNLNQRSITDRWWAVLYRDVLRDLVESSRQVDKEGLDATQAKNRKAINEVLMVYSYYVLISSFGDVPYSEALNIENIQPKYDKASDIFTAQVTKLNAALASLDPTGGAFGSADFILEDDVAGWVKFGNSLKMRMGILVADSDPATAKTLIEQASPNVVASNFENIQMHFLSSPPNTNPVWEDLIQSGRHDFVAAKPFVDSLLAKNDPRISFYFDEALTPGLGFVGQAPGSRASFNDFSAPSGKVSDPVSPYTYFSYAEMEFYKAEAVERGFSVGGTAEEHYNNAISASIQEWGGTAAEATTYLAQPSVAYSTAAGDWKQKIGVQSWISLYNRGYDAWTQWRRLDWPKLNVPSGAAPNFQTDEVPQVIVRLSYPVIEQNLNKANYEAASASIGKDWKTQKLWFDKF